MKKLIFVLLTVLGVFSADAASSVNYPYEVHFPRKIAYYGDIIELEDGSKWDIRYSHQKKTVKWRMSDTIAIELNTKNLENSWSFRLHNLTRDNYAMANLVLGPYYDTALWVAEMNFNAGALALGDGSVWEVLPADRGVMKGWRYNDTVMIGIDTTGSQARNILVNVNTMTYVSANCVAY